MSELGSAADGPAVLRVSLCFAIAMIFTPFLFLHNTIVDIAWLSCPPASFIGTITRRGLPLHCIILWVNFLPDQLTSAARFTKISRYGWAVTFRQDTFILPFRGSQKKNFPQDLLLINSWLSFALIAKRDLNDISVLGAHYSVQFNPTPDHAAVCAAPYIAMATGLRVCMNTVPGPTNLHTRPSLAAKLLIMPPDAIRSSVYLQFHATRWPLSMMYFSPSRS